MKKVIFLAGVLFVLVLHSGQVSAGIVSDVAVRAANQAVVIGFSSPSPRVAFVGKVTTSTGATFGRGTIVGKNVTAGAGANIGSNVRVGNNVTIEAGAQIPNGSSIPDGANVAADGTVTLKSGEKVTVQSLVR